MMNVRGVTAWLNPDGLTLYLLLLGCVLLGPWNAAGIDMFELDRAAARGGEYWRFWTGQLVHLSWQHLALTAAGIFLVQQLFGKELTLIVWLWGFAIISLTVGICVLAFSRFGTFTGASAILHGLFAYGAVLAIRRDALLGWGALIIIGAKVISEQVIGGSNWVEEFIGLPVAQDSHLYGFAAGVVLGAVMVAGGRGEQ